MAAKTAQHHPNTVDPYVLVVTKVLPYVLVLATPVAFGLARVLATLPIA
jgi:hypothetical protein